MKHQYVSPRQRASHFRVGSAGHPYGPMMRHYQTSRLQRRESSESRGVVTTLSAATNKFAGDYLSPSKWGWWRDDHKDQRYDAIEHALLLEYHKIQKTQRPPAWGLMHGCRTAGWHCSTPREMIGESRKRLTGWLTTRAMAWVERQLETVEEAEAAIIREAEAGEGERCVCCTKKDTVSYTLGPDDQIILHEDQDEEVPLLA